MTFGELLKTIDVNTLLTVVLDNELESTVLISEYINENTYNAFKGFSDYIVGLVSCFEEDSLVVRVEDSNA